MSQILFSGWVDVPTALGTCKCLYGNITKSITEIRSSGSLSISVPYSENIIALNNDAVEGSLTGAMNSSSTEQYIGNTTIPDTNFVIENRGPIDVKNIYDPTQNQFNQDAGGWLELSGVLPMISVPCILKTTDDFLFSVAISLQFTDNLSNIDGLSVVFPASESYGYFVIDGLSTLFSSNKFNGLTFRYTANQAYVGTINFDRYLHGLTPYAPPKDPYAPVGDSEESESEGQFDWDSGDDVDFPDLPTVSAVDTGLISLYVPTLGQIQSLASYMWSPLFSLDTLKKMFADPMDAILGLSIIPNVASVGGAREVAVGNIGTGISMNIASSQYAQVDCGSLTVNEQYGSYLDYAPYSEVSIYLPYIGIRPLKADDVMGKTVHVKYNIDILSGACIAMVRSQADNNSVLYTFLGTLSTPIPVTGNDWTNTINGIISAAASIGSAVATGGATAPAAVANLASTATNSMKPEVAHSGSLSSGGGLLGEQVPYLIFTSPRMCKPLDQNVYMGYPSFITKTIGDISGYNEIEVTHLNNVFASDAEIDEIISILQSGVIL